MTWLKGGAAGRDGMRLENSGEIVQNLVCQRKELEFHPMAFSNHGCQKKGEPCSDWLFRWSLWLECGVGPGVGRTGSLVSLSLEKGHREYFQNG